MRALVIHARRTGLGVIRSLGRMGVEVYAADEYAAPGFYSRHVRKSVISPRLVDVGEEAFADWLVSFGKAVAGEDRVVLFTASDDYLVIIAKYWDKLSPYFISTSETNEVMLRKNLQKDQMYLIAEAAGVPYPTTYYSASLSINDLRYPVVVKPTLRKSSDKDIGSRIFKVRKCADQEALGQALALLREEGVDFIVQEFIEGGDESLYTVGLFANRGAVLASGCARKLRQFPPATGECSFGELVDAPDIRAAAEAYVSQSGVTGICQIEFKKSGEAFYLMEINPRPWSWISLMEYGGVNLPYLACESVSGREIGISVVQNRVGGTWIFALMDLKYHVLENNTISFPRFLYDLVRANRHAYWDWVDPLPFFAAVYQFLKNPRAANQGRSVERVKAGREGVGSYAPFDSDR